MKTVATAPGKLILLGEYAVLDGAPAIVMAADRRARAVLESSANGACHVASAGMAPASFSLGRHGIRWSDADAGAAGRYALVAGVLESLAGDGELELAAMPPFSAELDTRAFYWQPADPGARPVKLGLGSSAALTVAFAAALLRHAGADVPERGCDRLPQLLAAHRRFQNGLGSGLDVAASYVGGVIAYRRDSAARVEVRRIVLPAGLALLCVWTGRAVETSSYVQCVRRYAEAQPKAYAAISDRLAALAERGVQAIDAGDGGGLIETMRRYASELERLGAASGAAIISGEHAAIARLAAARSAAYKPSGAGGGDVGIAVADDPERLSGLVADLRAAGFATVDLRTDPLGLQTATLE